MKSSQGLDKVMIHVHLRVLLEPEALTEWKLDSMRDLRLLVVPFPVNH